MGTKRSFLVGVDILRFAPVLDLIFSGKRLMGVQVCVVQIVKID